MCVCAAAQAELKDAFECLNNPLPKKHKKNKKEKVVAFMARHGREACDEAMSKRRRRPGGRQPKPWRTRIPEDSWSPFMQSPDEESGAAVVDQNDAADAAGDAGAGPSGTNANADHADDAGDADAKRRRLEKEADQWRALKEARKKAREEEKRKKLQAAKDKKRVAREAYEAQEAERLKKTAKGREILERRVRLLLLTCYSSLLLTCCVLHRRRPCRERENKREKPERDRSARSIS